MKAEATSIEGCYLLEPNLFTDKRGYFFESFNQQKFEDIVGTAINFVQDNQSKSSKGVLRGLHYQKGTFAQAKTGTSFRGGSFGCGRGPSDGFGYL